MKPRPITKSGYVYILTNAHMPGLVKIGRTSVNPSYRANQIYQTGVPSPFEVNRFVYTPDCIELELLVHKSLDASRVSPGREFFKIDVAKAGNALFDLHNELIEIWLSEFMPFHTIVRNDEYIDSSLGPRLAFELQKPPAFIIQAIEFLKAEDLDSAIKRLHDVENRENYDLGVKH